MFTISVGEDGRTKTAVVRLFLEVNILEVESEVLLRLVRLGATFESTLVKFDRLV